MNGRPKLLSLIRSDLEQDANASKHDQGGAKYSANFIAPYKRLMIVAVLEANMQAKIKQYPLWRLSAASQPSHMVFASGAGMSLEEKLWIEKSLLPLIKAIYTHLCRKNASLATS